ncbi:MAG: hypothetical protein QOE92_2244 [Chloroflexota bacterium]|nr:hypothetical protein [Chloroflexota bacterium]
MTAATGVPAVPAAAQSLGDAARTRPVAEVMRHGVVLCDADVSARDAARTMVDRGVTSLLAVDISSELIGLVDEGSLVRAWETLDDTPCIDIVDPDPLIVDPAESVGEVARRMLAAGVTRVLVAPPPPGEESGRWSEWKERGLPLGMLTVTDILSRLEELEAVVRVRPARAGLERRSVAPWIALASILVVAAVIALVLFAYLNGTHQYTNKPGLG